MNFGFTAEQELLRSQVRGFLDANASLERVRQLVQGEDGFSRELWRAVAELGWLGLNVPEDLGGSGSDLETLVVVLEETGRSLFPSPLLSTVLAAEALRHGSDAQRQRWLPRLADGSCIGTVAFLEESDLAAAEGIALRGSRRDGGHVLSGRKLFVADAPVADLFVVPFRAEGADRGISFALVERSAAGVSVAPLPSLDPTKRIGTLSLEGVRVGPGEMLGGAGSGDALLTRLLDVGATLATAESLGAAEGALKLTTEYARTRLQFGSTIGRFQGVKHPLAEAYVDIESCKSLVYYAAWALDHQAADASLAVSRAKAYASDALPRFGIDTVQLHGAIGYTAEYDAQLYLKRAKWFRPAFGDADHHYDRIVAGGGL